LKEAYGDEGIDFARETFGILNSTKGPSVVGNKRPVDEEVESTNCVSFERQGSRDYDKDAEVCAWCG